MLYGGKGIEEMGVWQALSPQLIANVADAIVADNVACEKTKALPLGRTVLADDSLTCRQPSGVSSSSSSPVEPPDEADASSFSSSQNVFSLTSERVVT